MKRLSLICSACTESRLLNLYFWTELGLLQLPLPPQGHPPQLKSDGSTNGYPLFKRVSKNYTSYTQNKNSIKKGPKQIMRKITIPFSMTQLC